ncbi:ABC transporter substrate-binding protein [Dietzia aerolata]|uniref:Hemin ABC transporter substrate-binding protein n=1 Tax=Dietzia aerolata TaxID=595984 RepID=A0ABV5JKE6_9ACTN|nr:ABC transporter substrate-binding protein [Dietzia aerolata]MBB0969225.1 ABC transporter substrate-binding protein [Dietzia aerolata]
MLRQRTGPAPKSGARRGPAQLGHDRAGRPRVGGSFGVRGSFRAAVAAALAFSLTSCGVAAGSGGDLETVSGIPVASEVEAIEDPRSYQGQLSLELVDDPVEPIAADPVPQLPAVVTDNQGTQVEVTDVSRILPLDIYGTLSRMVYELGLGDNVIGRDISSSFPEISDLPLVTTDGHQLNAESILALNPSVIITDTSLGPWDVILQLRDAGVPVVVVDSHRSPENVEALTQAVGAALGLPDEGRELGERTRAQIVEAQEAIATITPESQTQQLRTVFLYARGSAGVYYMFGQDSGADELITAAGGYDVSSEVGWKGAKPANDEGLIAAQPDVIIMMNKGLESVGGVDGLLEKFPAMAQTPAGANERIISMNDDLVLSFGTRTPAVLNALAVALYAPDAL